MRTPPSHSVRIPHTGADSLTNSDSVYGPNLPVYYLSKLPPYYPSIRLVE
jgi:hypothetical protein